MFGLVLISLGVAAGAGIFILGRIPRPVGVILIACAPVWVPIVCWAIFSSLAAHWGPEDVILTGIGGTLGIWIGGGYAEHLRGPIQPPPSGDDGG
jgi:hypothetical protein